MTGRISSLRFAVLTTAAFALTIPATGNAEPLSGEAALAQLAKDKACTGCDLGSADLQDKDLSGADLSGSYFGSTEVRSWFRAAMAFDSDQANAGREFAVPFPEAAAGANLSGANLSNSDLSRAMMNNADLSKANLSGARLNGTNLKDANIDGALFTEVTFCRTIMADGSANSDNCYVAPEGGYRPSALASGPDQSGRDLAGQDFRGISMTGMNLTGANLTGSNLAGADLRDANLTDADLSRSNLTDVDMTGATIDGAILMDSVLWRAKMAEYNAYVGFCRTVMPDGVSMMSTGSIGDDNCEF